MKACSNEYFRFPTITWPVLVHTISAEKLLLKPQLLKISEQFIKEGTSEFQQEKKLYSAATTDFGMSKSNDSSYKRFRKLEMM